MLGGGEKIRVGSLAVDNVSAIQVSWAVDWFGLRQIVSGDDGGHDLVIELAEIVASDIAAAADVASVASCVVGERAGRKVLLADRLE